MLCPRVLALFLSVNRRVARFSCACGLHINLLAVLVS